MKIATWNVNSIRARLPNVLAWVEATSPDVLLMQETKTVDAGFPAPEFEALGYSLAVHGQKSYNGVAIASRHGLEDVSTGLPGDPDDEQARYIEAWVDGAPGGGVPGGGGVRVASIYLPNGNPAPGPKFDYKLAWMERLTAHARDLLALEEPVILGGDYNIIPADGDCKNPEEWASDALARDESRARFRTLLNLGYTDAWRALHAERHVFSFWDNRGGAWEKDDGVRIDHLLLSPQATDRLAGCEIDRGPRSRPRSSDWPRASDHTPVIVEIGTG